MLADDRVSAGEEGADQLAQELLPEIARQHGEIADVHDEYREQAPLLEWQRAGCGIDRLRARCGRSADRMELSGKLAEGQPVAIVQLDGDRDAEAVEERAIAAAEVHEEDFA